MSDASLTLVPADQRPAEKKIYVCDIGENTPTIRDYFLLTEKGRAVANDKPYLKLSFSDRTGTIEGRMWDTEDVPASVDSVVGIYATPTLYKKKWQLKVTKLLAPPTVPDIEHFLKRSQEEPHVLLQDVEFLIGKHIDSSSPLRKLLDAILSDRQMREKLLRAPAAMKYHHAYIGGLLEHIRSLCRAAVAMRDVYSFDLPTVLAGCVLHDIGKVHELGGNLAIRYTLEGNLLGHVGIGFSMVSTWCERLEIDLPVRNAVLHVIASHHGTIEAGALREPRTDEALIFSKLDALDAAIAAVAAARELPSDDSAELTAWIPSLRTRFVR